MLGDLLGTTENPSLYLTDFLSRAEALVSKKQSAFTASVKATPYGKAQTDFLPALTTPTLSHIAANPFLDRVGDISAAYIQGQSSSLLRGVFEKKDTFDKGVSAATNIWFSAFALVNTATTQLAIQFPVLTANNLIRLLEDKNTLVRGLIEDALNLRKLLAVLLDSRPFFDQYLLEIIKAYEKIVFSHGELISIRKALLLDPGVFRVRRFEASLVSLEQALDHLTPETSEKDSARVKGVLDRALEKEIGRDTAAKLSDPLSLRDTVNAAWAMTQLIATIAKKMLQYVSLSTQINALLLVYKTSFTDFDRDLRSCKSLKEAQARQIKTATDALEVLIRQMGPYASSVVLERAASEPLLSTKTTISAGQWAIDLSLIISLLRSVPTAPEAIKNAAEEVVNAYTESVRAINAIDDIRQGTATLKVIQGSEVFTNTLRVLMTSLYQFASVITTRKAPAIVLQRAVQFSDHLEAALQLDNRLIAELERFLGANRRSQTDALAALEGLKDLAKNLGLDRVRGLIERGDSKELLRVTAATATYTAAAVTGLNHMLVVIKEKPGTTENQRAAVEQSIDSLKRREAIEKVEAERNTTDNSIERFITASNAQLERLKKTIFSSVDVLAAEFSDSAEGQKKAFDATKLAELVTQPGRT